MVECEKFWIFYSPNPAVFFDVDNNNVVAFIDAGVEAGKIL